MRSITINRKVVSYEPIEVNLLKFLNDNDAALNLMRETKSLEIRLPIHYGYHSAYVGYVNLTDLKCDLDYALNAIKNNRHGELFELHEDVIVLHDHLLQDAQMYLGGQDESNRKDKS